MDLWHPPADQPPLLEWWNPLLLASQAARAERCPWPIHIDEVMLMGRIDRGSRPAIWVYKHKASRGELYLDATGQAYKFTNTPNGRSLGRFTQCDVRAAIFRAGLPSFVQPVWYDAPPPGHEERWPEHDDDEDEPIPAARSPRRRGHLTVIDGGLGRPLAG
jgi:hypothetical protein